ncbi:MAG: pantetheine-phosphate adenylyltransferase [Myxococcota bacterium]
MVPITAIYAGSFDPLTHGHFDILNRAALLFDEVICAIGVHPSRKPLFTLDERLDLLRASTSELSNVEVASFEGLLIDYCSTRGAKVIIRGLRHAMDFEYELQIAQANDDMRPDVETVFLPTSLEWGFITASLVREIASHGGDISRYAPQPVVEALKAKFADRY